MALKIHVGRAKINDFIWSRNKRKDEPKCCSPTHSYSSHSSTNETAECAQEAFVCNTLVNMSHIKPTDEMVYYIKFFLIKNNFYIERL